LAVATTTTTVVSGCSSHSHRHRLRVAVVAASATRTAQPTCRLGTAAYSLASAVPPAPPYTDWPYAAPVSTKPGSIRGGATGSRR
jgi:hypothetical protein